jgi:hypothetical protein
MSRRAVLPAFKRLRWLAAVFALIVFSAPSWPADVYQEDAVKAAFLYRFTGYIEWPDSALQTTQFTIAVLDADAVAAELGRLLPDRQIHGLPARVRIIHSPAEIDGAQMLYVGAQYRGEVAAVAAQLAAQPLLLVSDRDGGLDQGAAVNFLLVDRRVRFEISLDAALRVGLRVGSALLSVATRVRGAPRSERPCVAAFDGECSPLLAAVIERPAQCQTGGSGVAAC